MKRDRQGTKEGYLTFKKGDRIWQANKLGPHGGIWLVGWRVEGQDGDVSVDSCEFGGLGAQSSSTFFNIYEVNRLRGQW